METGMPLQELQAHFCIHHKHNYVQTTTMQRKMGRSYIRYTDKYCQRLFS